MREELIRYIDLLFAGAPEAAEIKQEILQNTLDRYDDLVHQGKAPEAAYRLAISGIGDINEILGEPVSATYTSAEQARTAQASTLRKKTLRSIAVALYILCPVPLFIVQNEQGLCGLLLFVAVATALIIFAGKDKEHVNVNQEPTPKQKLRTAISSTIWTICLIVYLAISFLTRAWATTWIIFPLTGAAEGLVTAILDLKEAKDHEN